jgi:flagellar biosynthesis/type III secretory pathway chaperone
MEDLVLQLDRVLKTQIDGYRDLLAALDVEKAAIVALNSGALGCIAGEKELLVDNLQQLEDRRREIVSDLSAGMELSIERLTLAGLIKCLSAPQSESLRHRRRTLLRLTRQVKAGNRQNSVMYQHSLAFVRQALGFLHQAEGSPEYHPNGRLRKSGPRGKMVCSDV